MKSFVRESRKFSLLIAFAVVLSALAPIPAHAATVSFNCPSGGGTYQVNDATGTLTGNTGTCSGDLTLDSSVTTIGGYALSGFRLNTLTIPSTVTTISGAPFSNGGNTLTAITVDASNPNYSSLDGVLFNKAQTELISYPASKSGTSYAIPASVTSFRYYSFSGNKFITSINIPNTVSTLEGQVFYGSQALTTVNIGTGLTSLGDQNFAWLTTLTSINVDASNASFASIDGVLYSKNISKLWAYPVGKTETSYVAPNTVTSTAYSVFSGSTKLLTVDLSPVATLSGQEFMDATSVREVIFGDSLVNLKSQVLQSASGLRKLTLGTGLTTITGGAFYGNTKLYCVIYPGSNSTIQSYSFPNGVVPVATSASCLADPAFTLSSSTETAVTGTSIAGYTISSTGGTIASYSISPAITNTPGLSFSTTTGLISGTPSTAASSRTYTITATNAANTSTRTFAITVNLAAPAFTLSSSTISATSGVAVSGYTVSSTGGTIASYSISPAISNTPGLSFSSSTGRISGTPTVAASSRTYTITATNVTSTATRDFSITVNVAAPAFTLSSSSISVTTGVVTSGYTISSTGGTIASYSISPAISNTPGLVFSTSTGLISGTPTTAATSFSYTVTATNATNSATRTFAITVIAPTPEYVAPVPVPYLKTLTTPKLNLKDGKLICTPGTYNAGYTLDGVVQGSATALFTPSSYIYNLLINGVTQTSLAVTSASSSNSWNMSVATSGSLIACSVAVNANGVTNTDRSSDNTSATSSALTTQATSITTANADYSALLSANSKAYQKALVDNRATWRKQIDAIRTNYYDTLNRIKAKGGSKMVTDTSTALKVMIAAQKKSAADYKASQPAALAAKDSADKTALAARDVAIAKANAAYGTFIESIGYGVLIP